jgi:hypothetical protein
MLIAAAFTEKNYIGFRIPSLHFRAGEMKSLKHYFLSPPTKEQKETSKEPLQSSQSVNENPAAKQEEKETVIASAKEKRKKNHQEKKESKSEKLIVEISCEPVKGKTHAEENCIIMEKEIEVILDKKGTSPRTTSPVLTPKSNAFQLLMSQKKNITPETETEKKKKSPSVIDNKTAEHGSEQGNTVQQSKTKKKSLSLSNAKSKKLVDVTAEIASKETDKEMPKELSNGPVEEPARPQRASRQAKEKAKKSFLMSDEERSKEEYSTPRSKRSSRKKEELEKHDKKTAQKPTKPIQDKKGDEKLKKRKIDEEKCSPTKVQTNQARKIEEKPSTKRDAMAADESPVEMDIDEPEPSKELFKDESTKKQEEKPAEPKEVDSEDDFVLFKKSKKRKLSQKDKAKSPEKITPTANKKSIAGYFTSISKDEAIKRAAVTLESAKTQTIKADVHVEPAGNQRKRSMGPSGRLSSSKSPNGADSIEVLESISLETRNEDTSGTNDGVKEKSPMKSPLNKLMHRKKKLWEMKVKLLSPAKTVSEASSVADDSDITDSGNCSVSTLKSINVKFNDDTVRSIVVHLVEARALMSETPMRAP